MAGRLVTLPGSSTPVWDVAGDGSQGYILAIGDVTGGSSGGGGAVTVADGADVTQGAVADAAVAAGAAGTLSAKLRSISRDIGTLIGGAVVFVLGAGSALIGKVGIDRTSPGTTNSVAVITGQDGVAGGSGVTGATVQRVVLATDVALPAGTNLLGSVNGNVASGATDSGNPLKIGGIYNSSQPTLTTGQRGDNQCDVNGNLITDQMRLDATNDKIGVDPVPPGATGSLKTQLEVSSTGAASTLTATLAGTSGKTTYITGFDVTGSGATLGSMVVVTVTGLTNTLSYIYAVIAGALLGDAPLSIRFNPPIAASASNTAIVVTVPSLGTGNTNAAVVATGFQQ